VSTFTVAGNEFIGGGRRSRNITRWSRDRLAEIAGRYLGKGQQVAIEGRLQTRSWDDEKGARHWKTEIVASHVEMLSGRRKKDYEAQQAADSLSDQAVARGEAPATEPIAEAASTGHRGRRRRRRRRGGRRRDDRRGGCLTHPQIPLGGGASPPRRRPATRYSSGPTNSKNETARIA
jgi:single stranded DNA-binding protein